MRGPGEPWPEDLEQELRALWPRTEIPLAELAPRFDCCASQLSARAKRLGLPRRSWLRWPPPGRAREGRARRI